MADLRSILIANRGEIACRIARTCHDMGITTVAVFSDADRQAPHVRACDRAVHIGPADSAQSYLDIERVIAAAKASGCDAVHPGYGFLAENAAFARACTEAGLVFIGPSAEVIEALGSKLSSRELAEKADVPLVPSYPASVDAAGDMTFPVLIKASAGGGGKGMHVVREPDKLESAIESAARLAKASFGDDTLLCERYLEGARHVEIQIFGDHHGNLIHLGERDCSIQRRHQKIIEESPSPAVTPELRQAMGQAAVRLAKEVGYQNAGTVEFMLANDGSFYLLEVNTRLQVEHPVTEMVTGLDLVREQIRVAGGHPLSVSQDQVSFTGHAIEARLYAEDVDNGMLPATGTIVSWSVPTGPGLRADDGVESGSHVGIHYDPMVAKIIAHGCDRNEATRRLSRALTGLHCLGLTNNRRLLLSILDDDEFAHGKVDTQFLERRTDLLDQPTPAEALERAATVALASSYSSRTRARTLDIAPGWSNNPLPPHSVEFRAGDQDIVLRYRPRGANAITVIGDDGDETPIAFEVRDRRVTITDSAGVAASYAAVQSGTTWYVQCGDRDIELDERPRFPDHSTQAAEGSLSAPMPGRVVKVLTEVGAQCEAGDTLLILEAMKMEHAVVAPETGTVRELMVKEGDPVDAGAVLLAIDAAESR